MMAEMAKPPPTPRKQAEKHEIGLFWPKQPSLALTRAWEACFRLVWPSGGQT